MSGGKYHHGDLRRALVEAALEVVEAEGPEAVSLRALARRLEVSSAAPYRHVRDRDELMSAVAASGHRALLAAMKQAAVSASDGPMARYRAYGVRFVTFALERPRLFQVMHHPAWCDPGASPEMAAAHAAQDDSVQALIRHAQASGELTTTAAQHIAAQALVYGLARLLIDGHEALLDDSHEPAELIEAVIDVLGAGLIPRR